MKRRYRQVGEAHNVPSRFEYVCYQFNELALGLLVNRNIAQMWTNEEIVEQIHYVSKNYPLPWSRK